MRKTAALTLVIISIIGGLVFFIQKGKTQEIASDSSSKPTPFVTINKELGLTTYQSSKGKFSMQYPSDLELHVDEVRVAHSNTFHPVANVIELDSPHVRRNPYILVQYGENMTKQTIREYIENSSECEEVEDEKGEEMSVSGVLAIAYYDISCNSGGETRVYLIKGKMEYTIVFAEKPVDRVFLTTFLSDFHVTE